MLQLIDVKKDYKTAGQTVQALKGVNVRFRKNEFVSILGPSGCGKTTMLNIIGGLDQYTSGDLVICGKSTKDYKDHDWDVYRNHRIGFVFQYLFIQSGKRSCRGRTADGSADHINGDIFAEGIEFFLQEIPIDVFIISVIPHKAMRNAITENNDIDGTVFGQSLLIQKDFFSYFHRFVTFLLVF